MGPRVPLTWFDELHSSSTIAGFRHETLPGTFPDLRGGAYQPSSPWFCQPAMTAIVMGDLKGMTAARWAHVHGLTSAGLLPSHYRLRAGASWGQAQMADVYMNDFGHVPQVGAPSRRLWPLG